MVIVFSEGMNIFEGGNGQHTLHKVPDSSPPTQLVFPLPFARISDRVSSSEYMSSTHCFFDEVRTASVLYRRPAVLNVPVCHLSNFLARLMYFLWYLPSPISNNGLWLPSVAFRSATVLFSGTYHSAVLVLVFSGAYHFGRPFPRSF
ncbi:hypothetical protein F5148DRAFT_661459 [Russula earlei]|uniref:Uncharacterized protein n=1 Tax=Russula earlei TaxID=71964 RepID=A0ACC0UFG3_9AGAM|nr:hypothetical protein F5148DRAFT_661459 [Russula earlei]